MYKETATRPEGKSRPKISAVIVTKNGAERIGRCLESILAARFADKIVVGVDKTTTDNTEEVARRYTEDVHRLRSDSTLSPDALLEETCSHCGGEWILRVDDDERLGGRWDPQETLILANLNAITHFWIPRRWIVPPGDRFITNTPWFPDVQLRLFRNNPALLRWPTRIHVPVTVKGTGHLLADRWLEHDDFLLNDRAAREKKCQRYRRQRPEKHLSNLYLYEDEETETLPADDASFFSALAGFIPRPPLAQEGSNRLYRPGEVIRFSEGGELQDYDRYGWGKGASWGCWTNGPEASIHLPLEAPMDGPAVLSVKASGFCPAGKHVQRVRVFCEHEKIGVWSIHSDKLKTRNLPIPESIVCGKTSLLLEFKCDTPASRAAWGLSTNQRLLGLGVAQILLAPAQQWSFPFRIWKPSGETPQEG